MYIFFAALALGILVFIHELGHYFMARHVGMRVEAFGIGFGKPIYTWKWQGVEWRLCWLPFGGYVKIAGMEAEEGKDPYEITDGFFGAKPISRIKVAFMGPFVNLVFALMIFTSLWMSGGREKNFSEFTPIIGVVDPHSELYADGVRPGDIITYYGDQPFSSAKDHLYAPMTSGGDLHVKGYKVNYLTQEKTPFDYLVRSYSHPAALDKDLKTAGVLSSANYVIYNKLPTGQDNPLPEGSPLEGSGIAYGDRILWADGELVFSDQQLSQLLNDGKALLTIQRGDQTLLRRVPRVLVQELKLNSAAKEELADWQYESQLNNVKFPLLNAIPYHLTSNGVVDAEMKFIDKEHQLAAFPTSTFSTLEEPLKAGDKIIAVDGTPINSAPDILKELQQHKVNLIVERDPSLLKPTSWTNADDQFDKEINWKALQNLALSIGTENRLKEKGDLYLLKSIVPKMRSEFALSPENQARFATELAEKKKVIDQIDDPEKKAQAMNLLETREKQFVLGLPAYQDRKVNYNPNPFLLFGTVFDEIWHTLSALVMGYLNPKWISGPIGIVQVVQSSWMVSLKDGLFWIGAISLNLGVLNLLPIPVLDGGYICISLYEMISRRRLKPKTMEKLIIPFAILLIGFLIFLTYNDLLRIVGSVLS